MLLNSLYCVRKNRRNLKIFINIMWGTVTFECWFPIIQPSWTDTRLLIRNRDLFWIFRDTFGMFVARYGKLFLIEWFSAKIKDYCCKMESRIIVLSLFVFFVTMMVTSAAEERKKKSWRAKDIRDMTDADLEHLLEQWEVWPLHWIFRWNEKKFLIPVWLYINKTKTMQTDFLINVIS